MGAGARIIGACALMAGAGALIAGAAIRAGAAAIRGASGPRAYAPWMEKDTATDSALPNNCFCRMTTPLY
jgi:hypothetical protein